MMDESLLSKWLAALRSGKYQQAKKELRTEDGFCCLGVLCDVSDPSLWTKNAFGQKEYDGEQFLPPTNLLRAVGLTKRSALSLAGNNDCGAPFDRIADIIAARANLEKKRAL